MIIRLYTHPCGYRHWTTVTLSPANRLEDDTPPQHKCKRYLRYPGPVRLVGQHTVPDNDGWYE